MTLNMPLLSCQNGRSLTKPKQKRERKRYSRDMTLVPVRHSGLSTQMLHHMCLEKAQNGSCILKVLKLTRQIWMRLLEGWTMMVMKCSALRSFQRRLCLFNLRHNDALDSIRHKEPVQCALSRKDLLEMHRYYLRSGMSTLGPISQGTQAHMGSNNSSARFMSR